MFFTSVQRVMRTPFLGVKPVKDATPILRKHPSAPAAFEIQQYLFKMNPHRRNLKLSPKTYHFDLTDLHRMTPAERAQAMEKVQKECEEILQLKQVITPVPTNNRPSIITFFILYEKSYRVKSISFPFHRKGQEKYRKCLKKKKKRFL